ncbi:methyltransferase regulatory domain-containing protein [Pseudochrobactrum sp. HB0163]|uniref:methyltransferase regulatory domain-containing protein n=1 Tax=Pseudochrobactrum sp. HB0163 TaxID=3450708 RepID=UPI003F6DCC37
MNTPMVSAKNLEMAAYYDELPYQSYSFPQSTPEHMEAVAHIFGLTTPKIATARVLELGCASGGNLLPFAARYPNARAVGVDISKVHIGQANDMLKRTGLKNIRFEQKDLSAIDASFGTFDYIICHGVYSWVPEEVQDAIHRICAQCLSATGVAYISYNVYPGWKTREIVRDAMLYRGGARQPLERLSFGRGMIDFMHKVAVPQSALKVALDEIKPLIDRSAPYYLLHDFLEPVNIPVYFHEFTARAKVHETAYLADTTVSTMFASNYSAEIAEPLLKECTTQAELEQYLDFISNRTFRQTLLVRDSQASAIQYRLNSARFDKLSYAGFFEEQKELRQKDDPANKKYYRSLIGSIFITGLSGHAIAEALNEAWPATLSFDALLEKIVKKTTLSKEDCRKALQGFAEEGVIKGYLRFRKTPVECATQLDDKPAINAALRKVLQGLKIPSVCVWNNWHEPVSLEGLEVLVASRLDGSRTIKDLVRDIDKLLDEHSRKPDEKLAALIKPEELKTDLEKKITAILKRMQKTAILEKN